MQGQLGPLSEESAAHSLEYFKERMQEPVSDTHSSDILTKEEEINGFNYRIASPEKTGEAYTGATMRSSPFKLQKVL